MGIHAGRASHRLGQVGIGDGVDTTGRDRVAHQLHQIGPHRVEDRTRQCLRRQQGVDAVAEQHLRAEDVADSGEDLLIHQQHRDRAGTGLHLAPGPFRIGVGSQRIGPR
ncbi:hypothetical protein SDC9_170679 [bioreactor metagenome]|uniref:Uncharacterized protein n=1 Tax=bioreactor metagenome TaxID=1076179 RepID=A0A645G8Q1_9ZZZZ